MRYLEYANLTSIASIADAHAKYNIDIISTPTLLNNCIFRILPAPDVIVGFIKVTILFSIITNSNVVLSSAVTPIISTKAGENSSSNSSSFISKSFSIPIGIIPSPYALPTPSGWWHFQYYFIIFNIKGHEITGSIVINTEHGWLHLTANIEVG